MRIGIVVNPDAGLGGRLGFKGSDGRAKEAREAGAVDRSGPRMQQCISKFIHLQQSSLNRMGVDPTFVAWTGRMGGDWLDGVDYDDGIASDEVAIDEVRGCSRDPEAPAQSLLPVHRRFRGLRRPIGPESAQIEPEFPRLCLDRLLRKGAFEGKEAFVHGPEFSLSACSPGSSARFHAHLLSGQRVVEERDAEVLRVEIEQIGQK